MEYPNIDPVIFQIGPLAVHWYGAMYLVGFFCFWALAKYRAHKNPDWGFHPQEPGDMIFYGAIGVVLGGRIGYTLFYGGEYYLHNPLAILKVWEGGMSFHGGLLGVLIVAWWYARKTHRPFWVLVDFVAPLVPTGLLAGRIANFINGELWGRVTDSSWGMVFPGAGDLPRHPSQLYEAFGEGIVLFIVLWAYSAKSRPVGAVSGLFAIGYGVARFVVEYFREPDAHIGMQIFDLTRGQLLTIPLILVGIALMVRAYKTHPPRTLEKHAAVS